MWHGTLKRLRAVYDISTFLKKVLVKVIKKNVLIIASTFEEKGLVLVVPTFVSSICTKPPVSTLVR
jgi:hypothetical protein